jgi:hypothetical protein
LVSFLFSLVGSNNTSGVAGAMSQFLRNARRSGILPGLQRCHASTITRARAKVSWEQFKQMSQDIVDAALEHVPYDENDTWKGLSVVAIDGSKYTLPATPQIRAAFEPHSGTGNGYGHYPLCTVSTAYDVFRRIPLARTVAPRGTSERDHVAALLERLPRDSVVLFDMGYPSYELLRHCQQGHVLYYVFRCPVNGTFPEVMDFLRCGGTDGEVELHPSDMFRKKYPGVAGEPLRVRVVRMRSEDGTVSVLLTNLHNPSTYSTADIHGLYLRRWKIEEYYRDEKCTMDVEQFHSKTVNGVLQELYVAMAVSVIARTLMRLSPRVQRVQASLPQFKNAVVSFAAEAFVLVGTFIRRKATVLRQLLQSISEVRYAPPRQRRPTQPRLCKKAPNKWSLYRTRLASKPATNPEPTICQA